MKIRKMLLLGPLECFRAKAHMEVREQENEDAAEAAEAAPAKEQSFFKQLIL